MRIALLIRRFVTTGGAERYAVEVARRLAKHHEIHVFAQEWEFEAERITFHRVPLLRPKPNFFNQWWFSWHTARMTRGFDVVYSQERVTHFDVMNIHVGTFVGGLWGTARGEQKNPFRTWLKVLTDPSIWAYLLLEKLHSRPAPGRFWVADSEMVKREVQQYYPIPDDRFVIAHSGVELPGPNAAEARIQWRRKLGFKDDEPVLLFVGSEFRRKGLEALIEALGKLQARAPKSVIVGGEDRTPYEKRARELQISERLIWAGRVNNVQDYYALADIFVLPTLSDASPLSPLEAMAHGCAVIMSNVRHTGAAELAAKGEAILLEDPRNADEIAGAIQQVLDPNMRRDYAEKGRNLARKLSWDRTTDVILGAIEQSFRERRQRATR